MYCRNGPTMIMESMKLISWAKNVWVDLDFEEGMVGFVINNILSCDWNV